MNKLLLGLLALTLCNCATPKPKGFILPPALSEVYRNGELKGHETNMSGDLGIPNDSDLVSKVCVSKPQFNLYGQYVGTIVKCW
jgi:hypothetical protein